MAAKKTPRPTTRKGREQRRSATAARDMAIFHRRVFGQLTWAQCAAETGVGEATCKRVVARMEKQESLLERDSTALVEWMLKEHGHDLLLYTIIAGEARHENAMIGALNGREATLGRIMDLLKAAGAMPKDLGDVYRIRDFQMLVDVMFDVLEKHELPEVAQEIGSALQERGAAKLLGPGPGS